MRGIRLLGQSISPFLGSPPRWLVRWGRLRLMILFTTLLALLLVQYPSALFANLDAAWSMVLVHIHRQGLQLGRDVAFTYGLHAFAFAAQPSLLQRNLRFYQSSSAPQFVFAKLQSIDGRYRAQEDSLLLAELPRRYFAVLRAADYTLLQRKPVQPEYDSPRKVISRRPVVFGEEVTLPANDNYSVELRGFFKPSIYGALRGFVVQPAQVNIVLTDRAGKEHAGRHIPSIAKAGFVVQPLLESQQDFSSFIDGQVRTSVRSIRFEPAAGTAKCWSRIDMQLAQLSDLPLRPLRPD